MSCSSGILDGQNCRCCNFNDFEKYLNLTKELDIILNRFKEITIDASLQSKIDEFKIKIKYVLDQIKKTVITHCGQVPPSTISYFFEYVQENLRALKIVVEAFQFDFNLNTCKLRCDEAAGEVPVKTSCQCIFLQGYEKLYALRDKYNIQYGSLIRTLFDSVQYYEEFSNYKSEYNYMWTVTFRFQNNWDDYTLEEKYAQIEETITRFSSFEERVNIYIGAVHGPCANTCDYFSVPKATESCACYKTDAIRSFYSDFEKFLRLEINMRYWSYGEDMDSKTRLTEWAERIRSEASVFYNSVVGSVFDSETQQQMVDTFFEHYEALRIEWEAYAIPPTCTISCTGDKVKKCNTCRCVDVSGWENLLNEIYPDIDKILNEIQSLDTDESNKVTLTGNANTIKTGTDTIRTYSVESCKSLDEGSVRDACTQLTGLYQTLKTQIIQVKNQVSSLACTSTCRANWIQEKTDVCKCICLPFTCNSLTQAIDPYHCQCAPKSACEKTVQQCKDVGQYLDYVNCICMP